MTNDELKSPTFEEILLRLKDTGNFPVAVLAGEDGLPIAVAPSPSSYDADTMAAMVTSVKDFLQETQVRLGLAEIDEISIVVGDRKRLICRYFNAAGRLFVLALVAPPDQSYRRLMNRAAREIAQAWAE